jgi:nucleotide-binding universal stress UspA family protein
MPSAAQRRILVAVDFSPASTRAVREAARMAGSGDELVLVHVARRLEPALPWSRANRRVVAKLARESQGDARAALTAIAERLAPRVRTHVAEGVAHEQILAEARRVGADLIVLGSRGHTLSERLLLGSTAERVIRKATVPVLVVPAPQGHRARV